MSEQVHGRRRWLGDFPLNRPGHSGLSGPIYPKLLRLKHLHPSAWQRAALVEGSVTVGAVAALADQVTAWTPVILPVAVAAVVKFHDVLTGVLRPSHLPHAVPAPVPTEAVPTVAMPTVAVPTEAMPTVAVPTEAVPTVVVPTVVVPTEPAAAVAAPRPRPVPEGVSRARLRADLDWLSAASLAHALDELTRRGGFDTCVLTVDAGGAVSVQPLERGLGGLSVDESVEATVAKLAQRRLPTVRAVAVMRDVSLPGKDRRDAIRLDLEHVDGQTERVTATYRWTGRGGPAVIGELTRRSGWSGGVLGRVVTRNRD